MSETDVVNAIAAWLHDAATAIMQRGAERFGEGRVADAHCAALVAALYNELAAQVRRGDWKAT